ncbi:uncharacterized protein LOC110983032 [Acanthaster planci]|uniref:Uncharacterized protein LOC110983032 n=1 Tax=Acanthaster planci TaxID=133434 RepID=A0A8B7YYL5_ACAPL|nr:uncharacterized protein LOC110983032 [Acanthaster planci]
MWLESGLSTMETFNSTGISESTLRTISEKLGPEWEKLMEYLGLSPEEIFWIKKDQPDQTKSQIFRMLVKWRRKQSTCIDQLDALYRALMKICRGDIVEELKVAGGSIVSSVSAATHLADSPTEEEIQHDKATGPASLAPLLTSDTLPTPAKAPLGNTDTAPSPAPALLVTSDDGTSYAPAAEDSADSMSKQEQTQHAEPPSTPRISDSVLRRVAEKLGGEWKKLATSLGLSAAVVFCIQMDQPGQTENQIFNMLVKWRRKQPSNVDQTDALCRALRQIGREDIAEEMSEIARPRGPYCFDYLKQQVIQYYKQTATTIPAHPTVESRRVGIEDFSIPLCLIKKVPGKTKQGALVSLPEGRRFLDEAETITLDSMEDLFNPQSVGEIDKILLFGGAGMGKSTLLVQIAHSCIKLRPKSPLARFQLVLLIKLRQMQKSSCVLDAIFDQILPNNTNLTKHAVKGLIDEKESHIAFLLDGLDEIPSDVLHSKEGVYRVEDILSNRCLKTSFVLVTTRPHLVDYVLQGYPNYAQVQTTGFTSENTHRYIRTQFSYDQDGEALVHRLDHNSSLEKLSHVPIIALMLCAVWKNQKSLPAQITELYTDFIESLFRRRSVDSRVMAVVVNSMGGNAMQGLLNPKEERLVFDRREFQECGEPLLNQTFDVGLLQSETVTSGLKTNVLISFPHKSFQEYVAACHMVKLLEDGADRFRHQLKYITADNVLDKEYLLRFCCGRLKQAAGLILDHIRTMEGDEMQLQRLARLLLLESGTADFADKLVRPRKVSCERSEDLRSFSYYVKHVPQSLESAHVEISCKSKEDLYLLGEILLRRNVESGKSILVSYYMSHKGAEELQLLERILKNEHGKINLYVHIERESWFDWMCVSMSFARIQEHVSSFALRMNHRSRGDVLGLLSALKRCSLIALVLDSIDLRGWLQETDFPATSGLKYLQFRACRLQDDDLKDLIASLDAEQGLISLNIGRNQFSLNGVRALTGHLKGLSTIDQLWLHEIGLDAKSVREVVSRDMPHLQENGEGRFERKENQEEKEKKGLKKERVETPFVIISAEKLITDDERESEYRYIHRSRQRYSIDEL